MHIDNEIETAEIIPAKKQALRLAGRPFLLVNVLYRPEITRFNNRREEPVLDGDGKQTGISTITLPCTRTHRKGWHNRPGAMQAFERTMIVDRIKTRHLTDTSVIIDILRGDLIKSNIKTHDGASDDKIVEHYLSKYMDECKAGIDAYLTRMARAQLAASGREDAAAVMASKLAMASEYGID